MREQQLFDHLKAEILPDLQTAENPYSRWDCRSDVFSLYIELKCRRTHYDTLLVEKKKWDALHTRANEEQYRPIYINSTPAGIYVFALQETPEPTWVERLMPVTTDFANNRKISKTCGFLDVANAKRVYPLPTGAFL